MHSLRTYMSMALISVALTLVVPAIAQTARTGGAPNAQLLQQMQQLASERTGLQAQNAKLTKDLEAARKALDALKAGQKAVEQRVGASAAALARSAAEKESTEAELKKSQDRLQELVGKFRETAQTLQQVESERNAARQSLASTEQEVKVCLDHNDRLFKLNDEILKHFDTQSLWSRTASAEPFTRIKRAQLDNLVDDYKGRAEDQKVSADTLKSTASRPGGAPTPPAPTK